MDEEEEAYTKRKNREMLDGDGAAPMWLMLVGAGLAGGKTPDKAAKDADAVLTLAKERFL
jgi:hypothetical protein